MKHILKITACLIIAVIAFISCSKEKSLPPVANAADFRRVILPIDSVDLTGMGMDADGYIVSYGWRNISGPALFTLINPDNVNAKVKNMVRGIYEFELKVTDNDRLFAKDTTLVMVVDSLNDPLNNWDY